LSRTDIGPHGRLLAGIEAGGTKFVCAIGNESGKILARRSFATREPALTIDETVAFFREGSQGGLACQALGIGSFGPVETDSSCARYGEILNTPKRAWAGFNMRLSLAEKLQLPVVVDTDVNAAALAEQRWGNGRGADHMLYVTIGTGIGVGVVQSGMLFRANQHPEMGHMRIPISHNELAGFDGVCPFHGNCVEGLASGLAITERYGKKLSQLNVDHPAWALEADYLACFLANLTFGFQPDRIVVGGGVASGRLLELTRLRLLALLGGYRLDLESTAAMDAYVVSPGLADNAGVLGAMLLAANQ
jgi:fructokinase